jgi:hypothetical protein
MKNIICTIEIWIVVFVAHYSLSYKERHNLFVEKDGCSFGLSCISLKVCQSINLLTSFLICW